MYAMSPEQMQRQVVRSHEQARRQVALERQAAKAHTAHNDTTRANAAGSSVEIANSLVATIRRVVEAIRPRVIRPAAAR